MGSHINEKGEFQSDKYPSCPAGKVPLSVRDPSAQPLLWEYAQRHREVDKDFSDDLETSLKAAGYIAKREDQLIAVQNARTIDAISAEARLDCIREKLAMAEAESARLRTVLVRMARASDGGVSACRWFIDLADEALHPQRNLNP